MPLVEFFIDNKPWLYGWAFLLNGFMYAAYGVSAITPRATLDGKKWYAVWTLFTCVWSLICAWIFFSQLDALGSVVGRLAQFSGAPHELVTLHARAFMAIVIIVAVRGYFVISEMDNGRYAGKDELPIALAGRPGSERITEAAVRFVIIATLTLFISLFLRIIVPTAAHEMPIMGAPLVLEEMYTACAEEAEVVRSIGQSFSVRECVANSIANLPLTEGGANTDRHETLRAIAHKLMAPMGLLWLVYGGMIAWCFVVGRSVLGSLKEKARGYYFALGLQTAIAASAWISLGVMQYWVHTATTQHLDPLGDGVDVGSALVVISNAGIIIAAIAFLCLSIRLPSDFATALSLFKRAKGAMA